MGIIILLISGMFTSKHLLFIGLIELTDRLLYSRNPYIHFCDAVTAPIGGHFARHYLW